MYNFPRSVNLLLDLLHKHGKFLPVSGTKSPLSLAGEVIFWPVGAGIKTALCPHIACFSVHAFRREKTTSKDNGNYLNGKGKENSMTLTTKRRLIALVVTVVMASSLFLPAALANDKLATPVFIPKGAVQIIEGTGVGNSALHASSRALVYEPVEGATGYDVYAFVTLEDALAGENPVAISRNAQPTAGSDSTGGTTSAGTVQLEDNESLIDVRLIQFEDVVEGATRDLPEGYTPAGMGDTWMPGLPGSGDQTNLKPGQYWFRMAAVDVDNPSRNSDLSDLYEDEHAFTISMGPDEARALIEELLLTKELGDTLRIVDLRGAAEWSDEGVLRFTTDREPHTNFNTTEKAEAIFGNVEDKSAVSIFVF